MKPTFTHVVVGGAAAVTLTLLVAGPYGVESRADPLTRPSALLPHTQTALVQTTAPEPAVAATAEAPRWTVRQVAATTRSGPAFGMAEVERIRLRVWGYAELGGEYAVDPDLTVSLPGIGRVPVGNLSTIELERVLSERFSNFARREITVAVEVMRFQPYYIVGHIAEPGANEWRPGLNVVQAVALARGVRRPEDEPGGDRDSARQLAREQARAQIQYALAHLARLQAEKDGATAITVPESLRIMLDDGSVAQQANIRAIIAQQNAALAEQRALTQSQLDGLERDRQAAVAEFAAMEEQERQMSKQIEISRTLLEDITKLKDKQLVGNSRYLQQRSELITTEVRLSETRSLIERARSRLVGIETQIQRLDQERQTTINERIETLQRDIAQLQVNVADPLRQGGATLAPSLFYQIARPKAGGVETLAANVFTEVRPGDVIIVSSVAQPSHTATGQTPDDATTAEITQRALEASATSRPTSSRSSTREDRRSR